MAALTADRATQQLARPDFGRRVFPVGDGEVIYKGALVMLDADGYLVPGATATGQTAVGMALEHVDNSGGADGDLSCLVDMRPAKWNNSSGPDEIDGADIGSTVYIVDDQTVALTDGSSTRSAAGTVWQVESDGVFVLPPH